MSNESMQGLLKYSKSVAEGLYRQHPIGKSTRFEQYSIIVKPKEKGNPKQVGLAKKLVVDLLNFNRSRRL